MNYGVHRACVIGAGTMGAAIAAHLASAGIPVDLLDVVPDSLTPVEEAAGKTLADPDVRNRIVQAGFERAKRAKPAAFSSDDAAGLVTLGNTEDHFDRLRQADWVIEAIVENLDAKRALMAGIDAARKPASVISTNTSGIPIAAIAAGRSQEFRAHFLGTHFFNPPRFLRLLEVIPTADSSPQVVEFVSRFGERVLGKGIVLCKDTPNFIANRLGTIGNSFILDYALRHCYTVEEIDALTGELIGRPRTATFRLLDLVGLDVAMAVRRNLYELIPGDESRDVLRSPPMHALASAMIERGWLGNKSGQGFYRQVRSDEKKEYWPLNLQTLEYEPPQKVRFESLDKSQDVQPLGRRLNILLAADDRVGLLLRAVLYHGLAYVSNRLGEIADDIAAIDNAVRWGFVHQAGPFEIWDMLAVSETLERIQVQGFRPARWVEEMIAAGGRSFYQREAGRAVGHYDPQRRTYRSL